MLELLAPAGSMEAVAAAVQNGAEKMRRADRCIDASGSIEETQRKIRQLWEELA